MAGPYDRPSAKRGGLVFTNPSRPPDAHPGISSGSGRGAGKDAGQGGGKGGSYRPPGDIGKGIVHGSTRLNPNVDADGEEVKPKGK